MGEAIFPFCLGLLAGCGLTAIPIHALAIRWLLAEHRMADKARGGADAGDGGR